MNTFQQPVSPNRMPPQGASGGSNIVFQLRNLLQSSQSILIGLGEGADEDATAASLALYLILSKMRKQVTIISPSEIKVDKAHLFGIDKITNRISGSNTLVVSLPYAEGSIEKVSYNIENNRFNLVIEPRGKALAFDPNQIEYNYGKGEYDLVFVIGAGSLNDLGQIAKKHANAFAGKPIINIDKSQNNTGFGRVNLVNNAPISQTVTMLLKSLRIPIDQDPASNLYTGITSAQKSITLSSASPDTLETMAFLMRSNAQILEQSGKDKSFQQQSQQKKKNIRKDKSRQKYSIRQDGSFTQPIQPQNQQFKQRPVQQQPVKQQQRRNPVVQQPVVQGESSQDVKIVEEAPEDWLKPKIFTTQNSQRSN